MNGAYHEGRRSRIKERRTFRSSIHINLGGGSRSRSIDGDSASVDFQVDPNTKKLVNTALSVGDLPAAEDAPEFITKPKHQFINEGETAKFKASFEGSSSTQLTWSINGKIITKDDRHKMYTENDFHILEILKAVVDDNGSYTCKIENSGGAVTANADLEVFVRPKAGKKSKFVAPTIDVPLEDTEFADRQKDATLVCKFHNAIDGQATWFKDGREVSSFQAKTTFDGRTAKLVIKEASKRMCGSYECVVKNTGGEAKTKATVSLLDPKTKAVPPKFTVTLVDQSLEAGEKLVLETEVTGSPRPSLTWYKDKKELGSSQDIRMEFKDGKGRLIVDNLDPVQGAKFTCVAKNVAGEQKTMANVNVTGATELREPPIFTKELRDMEATNGDRVEMGVDVKGTPPIDIVWVHNNREIPSNDPVCHTVTNGNNHRLIITQVFPEDSGEYVCEAYNDYGDTDTFCRLNVHEETSTEPYDETEVEPKSPEFLVRPRNLHVAVGDKATLSCTVTGEPPPSVQWQRGRRTLKHGTKYKISSLGDEHFLEIPSATTDDIHQYTCTICNPLGSNSATCELTVGETTRSEQRTLLRNRSQGSNLSRSNTRDSESSDISSVELEILQPTFAIKRSSAPTLESAPYYQHAVPAIVQNSPPVQSAQFSQSARNSVPRNSALESTPLSQRIRNSAPTVHAERIIVNNYTQNSAAVVEHLPVRSRDVGRNSPSVSEQRIPTHVNSITESSPARPVIRQQLSSPENRAVANISSAIERQIAITGKPTSVPNSPRLLLTPTNSTRPSVFSDGRRNSEPRKVVPEEPRRSSYAAPFKPGINKNPVPVGKIHDADFLPLDKKGGVTQVDFRSILKNNSAKQSKSSELTQPTKTNSTNGHSKKLGSPIEPFSLTRRETKEDKRDLSQKRSIFETDSDSVPVKSRSVIINGRSKISEKSGNYGDNGSVKSEKVNQALKNLENKTVESKPFQRSAPESGPFHSSVSQSKPLQSTVFESKPFQNSVPQSLAPTTSVSPNLALKTSVSRSSAPQTSVSQSSAPPISVSQSSVPQTSVSRSAAPQTSVPKSVVPHSDYRSVLKPVQNDTSCFHGEQKSTGQTKVKPKQPEVQQLDFRNVLKQRSDAEQQNSDKNSDIKVKPGVERTTVRSNISERKPIEITDRKPVEVPSWKSEISDRKPTDVPSRKTEISDRKTIDVLKWKSEISDSKQIDVPTWKSEISENKTRELSTVRTQSVAKETKVPSAFINVEKKPPGSSRKVDPPLSLNIEKAKQAVLNNVNKSRGNGPNGRLKDLTSKLKFRSVSQERDNDKDYNANIRDKEMDKNTDGSYSPEVVRPIPRRLSSQNSQSKQSMPGMEGSINSTQRRTSASKLQNVEVMPAFRDILQNKSVRYGSEVTLQCQVIGKPNPDICWAVNRKEIKQSKYFRMSYLDEMATLVIAEAYSEDEGEYTCTATNCAGTATTSCNIDVQDRAVTPENVQEDAVNSADEEDPIDEPFSPTATPPKIYNISPAEFCIKRGGSIEFKASYTSVPAGTVSWYKRKRQITNGERMSIKTDEQFSTLTIDNIQPSDSGRFDITVENKLGSHTGCVSLTVEDVPEAPVGTPCVSEVTLHSMTLSWYGPAYDGGTPVTNYRVEMCDAEEHEWTLVTAHCESTTCRIDKLLAHTPYFFRVFAENKHGLSDPSVTPDVTVTSDRRPSALLRLPSTESDDVFTHEPTSEVCTPLSGVCTPMSEYGVCTPLSEYGLVSPLSPDEASFEHREVSICLPGRKFEHFYNCKEEVGKGKFGSVYKCEEKSTGKIWAAKIVKCREAEKKKLHLEVEIMNQLKHPKILMLWDAFDAPRKMILVMEYIGGGELFERVLDDDFELTERDCIQFMRQICDAVNYMHSRNILHLDLKPENVLCIKNESNKIKIIDFGLARYYNKGESVRVLFGTPEFIAPEVVNYDEIGFTTDMWSVGVICYVLLTGLSPFMGDSDAETLANVTQGEFDFEEEEFDSVSQDGKNYIDMLLVKDKSQRMTSMQALQHAWLAEDAARLKTRKINTKNLKRFMARRKWQKTGNAIRALGRITSLQKMLKGGSSSGGGSQSSVSSASGQGSSSSSSSLTSMGSQSTLINAKNSSGKSVDDAKNRTGAEGDAINSTGITASKNSSHSLKESGTVELEKVIHSDEHLKSTNQEAGNTSAKSTNQNGGNFRPTNHDTESTRNVNCLPRMNIDSDTTKSRKSAFEQSAKDPVGNGNISKNRTASDIGKEQVPKTTTTSVKCDNQPQTTSSGHPQFTKEMVDSKAFPGDAVRFEVVYKADATMKVTWYFEDDLLTEDDRHSIIHESNGTCKLVIKDVCEDDDGEYSCKITNTTGDDDTCSAELIVYGAL